MHDTVLHVLYKHRKVGLAPNDVTLLDLSFSRSYLTIAPIKTLLTLISIQHFTLVRRQLLSLPKQWGVIGALHSVTITP